MNLLVYNDNTNQISFKPAIPCDSNVHQYVTLQENEQLKEDLKKETYKRKKLKERFMELQELVNDENVVLLKEVGIYFLVL